jgi:hypothetical protein
MKLVSVNASFEIHGKKKIKKHIAKFQVGDVR